MSRLKPADLHRLSFGSALRTRTLTGFPVATRPKSRDA